MAPETATIFVIEGFLQDGRPLGRAEVSKCRRIPGWRG